MDADHLLVATNYGRESLDNLGLFAHHQIMGRGTPLSSARTISTGSTTDVGTSLPVAVRWGNAPVLIYRSTTIWTGEVLLVRRDGSLVKTPLPETADLKGVVAGRRS